MKLRKLNESGTEEFERFRNTQPRDESALSSIVSDARFSEEIGVEIAVRQQAFETRFEVGKYLDGLFSGAEDLDKDKGLWTWLAAFYFEQLCPPGSRPGENARWVPAVGDFRKYYRHLLAGPYQIYRAYRENPLRALALLATPPHRPGDIVEQLASRQELVTNKSVIEVATRLYIDPKTSRPKRGAASNARRFADTLNQLDLIWDLYALDPDQLLRLLPSEFLAFAE